MLKTIIAFNVALIIGVIMLIVFHFDNDHPAVAQGQEGEFRSAIESSNNVNMSVDPISPDKLRIAQKESIYQRPPEIIASAGKINVNDDLQLGELIGEKVILVKFWTFGCVNCQATFPHVNRWYEDYKEEGLEIVSFHTPEFAYEHKLSNVEDAVEKWGIEFPVLLDNEYENFNAYNNHYWPHVYLIDKDGFIVYDHIGQGDYDATEEKIKELLIELNKE